MLCPAAMPSSSDLVSIGLEVEGELSPRSAARLASASPPRQKMAGFGGSAPPLPYSPKRKDGDGQQCGSRPWRTKLRIAALFLVLVALVLLRLGSDDAENDLGVDLPSDQAVAVMSHVEAKAISGGPAIAEVPGERNATTSFDEASVQLPDTSSATSGSLKVVSTAIVSRGGLMRSDVAMC